MSIDNGCRSEASYSSSERSSSTDAAAASSALAPSPKPKPPKRASRLFISNTSSKQVVEGASQRTTPFEAAELVVQKSPILQHLRRVFSVQEQEFFNAVAQATYGSSTDYNICCCKYGVSLKFWVKFG